MSEPAPPPPLTPEQRAALARTAVAYIRTSTPRQDPELQRVAIERYAAAHGVHVVAWFIDHGYSGDDPTRPALPAALAAIEAGAATALIVRDFSRLARHGGQARAAWSRLEAAGGRLLIAEQSLTDLVARWMDGGDL